MDFTELKTKNSAELTELLKEERSKLYRLRRQAHAHALKQVHEIAAVRKTVARLTSLLSAARSNSR